MILCYFIFEDMTCEKCGKTFIYDGNLASHRIMCGGDTSKYRSDVCGKHYSNKKSLRSHKKNHQDDVC